MSSELPYVAIPVAGDVAGLEANSSAGNHGVNNLQTEDPTETWRSDGTSPAQVDIDLGAPRQWNIIGFTETNASATSKNLLESSAALSSAPWVLTSATTMALTAAESPLGESYPAFRMTLTGTTSSTPTSATQSSLTLPENIVGARVSLSVWAKAETGDAGGFFIRIDRGGSDFYLYYDGTAQAFTNGSLWSDAQVAVETYQDGWVRLYGSALFSGVDAGPFTAGIYGNDGGTGSSLDWSAGSGTHTWLFYRPTVALGLDNKPYDGLFYADGRAALMRIRGGETQAELTSGPDFDSGYRYACRALDYRDEALYLGQVSALFGDGVVRRHRWLRIEVLDTDNPDGYFQAGRLWIDNAWRPEGGYNPQASYGPDEKVQEKSVEGGGPFRRTHRRRNRSSLVFDYLSEDQAFNDAARIKHVRGLSEDLLVIPDLSSGHSESQMVHGFLDSFDPPINRTGTIFQVGFNMKGL